ncbi:hypothetical protein ACO0QE_000175 [Hanseniaspora vineae]
MSSSKEYTAFVLGSTGLCGGAILKHCMGSGKFAAVTTLTRRELPDYLVSSPELANKKGTLTSIVDADSENWATKISAPEHGKNNVFFSGLGTTRAQAHGFANQYKIDHDLNVALAQKAKEAGYNTYVLVSSIGASKDSMFAYTKMKGEIEDAVEKLGFENLVVLRPGLLLGDRHGNKSQSFMSSAAESIGSYFYRSKLQKLFGCPVYGEEVGEVAVKLALETSSNANPSGKTKVRIVESKDILDLAAK